MAEKPPSTTSSRLRSRVERSIAQAEEQRKREMLRRRIELARAGVVAYQKNKIGDAVKALTSYLKVMEGWKGVAAGGLTPGQFDPKKDLAELLLISGVYWDLTRYYDRPFNKSREKPKEFTHYLQKFILFSRGMPFQPLCAETLRKYIKNGRPNFRADLKSAYKMIGKEKCFVASSVMDIGHPDTLPRLRRFRDDVLKRSSLGRQFVAWYYRRGPRLALWLDLQPNAVRICVAQALRWIARLSETFFRFGSDGK